MNTKAITTKQVLVYSLKHGTIILSVLGFLYASFVVVNRVQEQWAEHTENSRKRELQLEKKLDTLQATVDKILLLLAKRR